MCLCISVMESEVVWGKNIFRNVLVFYLDGIIFVCEDIGCSFLIYGCCIFLVEWESWIVEVDVSVVCEICFKYIYD